MTSNHLSTYGHRFPAFLRLAHWASVVMVLLAYLTVYARNWLERGTPERLFVVQSHFLLGILILLLTLPRIVARLRCRAPRIVPEPSLHQVLAAATAHFALFLFLVVQPLLGMAIQLVSGRGIGFPLTSLSIPGFSIPDAETAKAIAHLHVFVGELFIYVIAAHVLAALWHRWVRKDNAMQRML